jgi:RND family efflux transporter MFP subunit
LAGRLGSRHVNRELFLRALVAGAFAIFTFLGACSRKFEAPPKAAPPLVYVTPATGKKIVEWDEYTGRLASTERVEVRARVSGYLESVHFKDGQMVKAGDLLFVIDPRPYQAKYDRAFGDLRQAEAKLRLAQLNDQRTAKLSANKVISQEEIDSRRNELLQAQAAYEAAKANTDEAKLDLDFTRVTAPISGRIDRKLVTEGNLIRGSDAGDPTLLTTIVSLDPIYCYFEVDERSMLKYQRLDREGKRPSSRRVANPVQLQLADETGFPHAGRMDFVENQVDPQTDTIQGRAVFPNPDLFLTPGIFARVRLIGSGEYEAVLIPDQAVVSDQSQKFVNIVKPDGSVEYRKIELGPMNEGLRIVRSGLQAGEKVITRGAQRLQPGLKVQAQPDNTTATPSPTPGAK